MIKFHLFFGCTDLLGFVKNIFWATSTVSLWLTFERVSQMRVKIRTVHWHPLKKQRSEISVGWLRGNKEEHFCNRILYYQLQNGFFWVVSLFRRGANLLKTFSFFTTILTTLIQNCIAFLIHNIPLQLLPFAPQFWKTYNSSDSLDSSALLNFASCHLKPINCILVIYVSLMKVTTNGGIM